MLQGNGRIGQHENKNEQGEHGSLRNEKTNVAVNPAVRKPTLRDFQRAKTATIADAVGVTGKIMPRRPRRQLLCL
jgi:hypothetical protein